MARVAGISPASVQRDVLGKGPNGQIEWIHDADNDLSIIGGITKETLHTALDGAKTVILPVLNLIDHSGHSEPQSLAANMD